MELSIYSIIKKRVITPKSLDVYKKYGKVTFEVHTDANKIMIKQAVEKIWNVKVDSVRVLTVPGKTRSFGRRSFKSTDGKKAIIALKKGYKIDLPVHFETMGAQSEKEVPVEGK